MTIHDDNTMPSDVPSMVEVAKNEMRPRVRTRGAIEQSRVHAGIVSICTHNTHGSVSYRDGVSHLLHTQKTRSFPAIQGAGGCVVSDNVYSTFQRCGRFTDVQTCWPT